MKIKLNLYFKNLCMLMLFLLLQACSNDKTERKDQIVTLQTKTLSSNLYYSGIIQPFKTIVVPSPQEGIILEMPFEYGSQVNKGQLLFTISSAKFLSDYKAALLAFVKAKSDFDNNKTLLSEAEFLHKNELISNDDFKMKQSTYYAAQLSYLQAKDSLDILMSQLSTTGVNLLNLDITNITKITKALNLNKKTENISIIAPASGIVLSPSKGEEESKKIGKGDAIKQGDVLAIIGDMEGISIRIKVNELTVNQLKLGQKVKITGIAFPDETLNGEIQKIEHQGETSGSGLPTFSIAVAVKNLTDKQRKLIHVGMSAKVEVIVAEDAQLMVPISALFEKNGDMFIKKYDDQRRKSVEVAVKTGKTSTDAVAILSGLKPGDKIVVPN